MPNLRLAGQNSSLVHALPDESQRAHILHLLRSHSQPPANLPSILSILSDELERYDVEMETLRERLSRLAAERVALKDHCDRYQSLLTPIRRLPSETLVEIFDLCGSSFLPGFESHPGSLSIALARLSRSPLLALSRVCTRWHNIVMCTPSLWATIELDGLLWEDPLSLPKLQNLLRNPLLRSGNHPLVVSVGNEVEAAPGPVFNLLAQHSGRWRTATFMGDITDLHHLSVARGNIHRPESLKIHGWGDDAADAAIALEVFQIAPRSRTLELTGGPEIVKALYKLPIE
ncbi:hypothetical protein DFH09DRAFT_1408826 [Mycena vulgaris]|nr:hypothetical protein DFH09DRAFT_1408826 [Mycena vulgaris]